MSHHDKMTYTTFFDSQFQQPTPYHGNNPYFLLARERLEYSVSWIGDAFKGAIVVDIGASPFYLLHQALALGAREAHGVFFTRDAHPLQTCSKLHTKFGPIYLHHVDCSTSELPFRTGTVDVVTMLETLEHFPYFPDAVARTVNRIARPDASFFVSVPNACSWKHLTRIMRGKNIFDPYRSDISGRHHHEYTREQLRDYFEYAGFNLEYCRETEIGSGHSLVSKLLAGCVRLPLFQRWRHNIFASGKRIRDFCEGGEPPSSLYTPALSNEVGTREAV